MATFTSGELAGIILGSMIGTLFLVTCVVSAVKAVKDRQQIKARIREKKRAKALASKLKKDGKLQAPDSAIEDPDYFARNNMSNNHRVVSQSNSCPERAVTNGACRESRGSMAEYGKGKRFSDPTYQRGPSGVGGSRLANTGRQKGRQQSGDLLNIGVYRYKGEISHGVENAGFEMRESSGPSSRIAS